MAQILSAPKEIVFPELPIKEHNALVKQAIAELQDYAKKHGVGPEAGELLAFHVGDGQARYVVFSLKPVQLIYVPAQGDYKQPYIHRMTASDIRKHIRLSNGLKKLIKDL